MGSSFDRRGRLSCLSDDGARKIPDTSCCRTSVQAIENIDYTRTKARSPQTNGICERFHKTLLDEFYRVAFRKKLYRRIEELQVDLDAWLVEYNEQRPHQGR
jgi:transposase InsO family protein